MKKKRILLAVIVVVVMLQAAWLVWLAVITASGARPFRVSDGFCIAEQIFLDIMMFYNFHQYWNEQSK